MAAHDVVASQLAKLEMEQLKADMDILKNRAENLEIKSPIDGIVISGDQERAEGAPLTVGQSLFEIAPLDKMIVEVAVPENEINYVEAGLDVTIRLDSFPRRTWTGTIRKVHPRAEIRDDENVFIAEVYLDNPGDLLRPGMNGRAKVISGRRPLAWNLFHKPWETMLTALGW
jgi:multidrug efflux pump subunit AcrA (membrane-fusion protein)